MTNKTAHRSGLPFFVVIIAIITALSGILFGFDTAVISGAMLYVTPHFHLNHTYASVLMTSVLIGAFFGSLLSGWFADRYGRRHLLIITAFIFLVSSLLSALAWSYTSLLAGRFFVGIAVGVASFTAPLYISEVAPVNYRGVLVSLNQLAITIGIMLAYAVDFYFSEQHLWRAMFAAGVVPALLMLMGMCFLPRSPRWLLLTNQPDQARSVLQKIRATTFVDDELHAVSTDPSSDSARTLLRSRWLMPVVLVALGLAFLQQFTGINVLIYYAPVLLQHAGFFDAGHALSVAVLIGCANVFFTIMALPLVDRWGRRPLLLSGLLGMMVGLFLMVVANYYMQHSMYEKWMTLAGMLLYIGAFAMSLGPIMWLVIAEIFPLSVRGVGSSFAIACSWVFNALVVFSFSFLFQAFGFSGTFLLYGSIAIVGVLFVYFYVPETKGVSLETIEKNIRARVRVRDIGRSIH